ncbi:MAG: nucleoside deaminase, partial [Clostridia bacterium]|nr:nucleoside deaminase [Clostridia bacterium]
MTDERIKYMKAALKQAKRAEEAGEVPIGCVIVKDGKVFARAYNMRQKKRRITAHAEMLAIEKACKKIKDWRLDGAEMYITLEPCPMCAGAIAGSRIKKVYFGAYEPKSGGATSKFHIL